MVVIRGQAVTADLSVRALSKLFPADVTIAVAEAGDDAPRAYPEEEAAIARAVPGRRREFRVGRACARAALEAAGASAAPLPAGPDRAPVWPSGFVGSITHCEGFVAACVASADTYEGIGFDAERGTALGEDLVASVCTAAERSASLTGAEAKVLFAAKEAIHKCVAPQSGIMLDFLDVTVELNATTGVFRASLEPQAPRVAAVARVDGRFVATGSLVYALALLRRSAGSEAGG